MADKNLDKTQQFMYDLLTHFTHENLQPLQLVLQDCAAATTDLVNTKVLKMSFRCWFVVDQFVHQVDMAMCNLWCNRKGGCDDINALEHVYVNAC